MKEFDLDIFIPGKTVVGELINIDILFRNGQKITLTEELRRLKIKTSLVSIELSGRFNYVKISRLDINLIRFYMYGISKEAIDDAQGRVKDTGSGDGEEVSGELDSEMDRGEQDKKRKRDPYNVSSSSISG